ncbi:unnamed protein product [Rotaria sordida]|uniref:Vacuolar protein sorting-associated protein n=1 Tax=Rotaria sordida TaxID=392033 RepID=A0A813PA73_9BILA|nr:unnamed protein product [Rotaria sordida]
MVFENLVVYLLDKYLGDYIENLDTKKLKIDIWSGNVVLENLYLKSNALADLNLPVTVSIGYLQKLTLQVPWKNLYTHPTKATIDGLFLLVVPKTEVQYDAQREENEQHEAKMKEVRQVEELRKQKEAEKNAKETGKTNDTFVERMQLQIIRNLELSIRNIHIVYEDKSTKPDHPFALGITLNYITLHTTTPDGEPTVLKEDTPLIHKLGELSAFSIYWNSNAKSRSDLPRDEAINDLREKIAIDNQQVPSDIEYILRPLHVKARLILTMKPRQEHFKQPMFDVKIDLDEISLNMSRDQYSDLLDLLEFQDYLIVKSKYIKYQIKNDKEEKSSFKKWKFAYEAIVNEEIRPRFECYKWENIKAHLDRCREYREIHFQELTGKLTNEQKKRAEELEKKLDVFNLTYIRRSAEIEAKQKKEQEPKTWWGSVSTWWSGNKHPDDPELDLEKVMSPEEKKRLYDAIGYAGEDTSTSSYPEEYVDIDLGIHLNMLDVNIRSKVNANDAEFRIIARAVIPDTGVIFKRRPATDAIAIFIDLGSFQVFGIATDSKQSEFLNDSRPVLARPSSLSSSHEQKLLQIEFETNPLDKESDYRIKVISESLEIKYNAPTINKLAEFFEPDTQRNLQGVKQVAYSTYTDVKQRSYLLMKHNIEKIKVLDIYIDLQSSYFLLPENGVYKDDVAAICMDLGHLTLKRGTNKKHIDEESFLSKAEKNIEDARELSYTRFKLKLEDVQLIYANRNESWEQARKEKNTRLHLIKPMELEVDVDKCIYNDDAVLPAWKIAGNVPNIELRLSDKRLFQIINHIQLIPLPESKHSINDQSLIVEAEATTAQSLLSNSEQTYEAVEGMTPVKKTLEESEVDEESTEDTEEEQNDGERQLTQLEAIFTLDRIDLHIDQALDSSNENDDNGRPFLHLTLDSIIARTKIKTFDMVFDASLADLILYHEHFIGKDNQRLCLLSAQIHKNDSSEINQQIQQLVSINFLHTTRENPLFSSSYYNGIENKAYVHFSKLVVILQLEALLSILRFQDALSKKISKVILDNDVKKKDEEKKEQQQQLKLPEENKLFGRSSSTFGKVIKKNDVPVTPTLKIKADLEEVRVIIASQVTQLFDVQVQGVKADVSRASETTIVNLILSDLRVFDPYEGARYRKIVSQQGDDKELLRVTVSLFDYPEDYEKPVDVVDCDVKVQFAKANIIFLFKHIDAILMFLDSLNLTKDALDLASAQADAAYEQVQKLQKQAFKVHLDITFNAPNIIIPTNSYSDEALLFDLGKLTLKTRFYDDPKRSLLEQQNIRLENVLASRVKLSSEHGILGEVILLECAELNTLINRLLYPEKIKTEPEVSIKVEWELVHFKLAKGDYTCIMKVLMENFTENIRSQILENDQIEKYHYREEEREKEEEALRDAVIKRHKDALGDDILQTVKLRAEVKKLALTLYLGESDLTVRRAPRNENLKLANVEIEMLEALFRQLSDTSYKAMARVKNILLDDLRATNKSTSVTRMIDRHFTVDPDTYMFIGSFDFKPKDSSNPMPVRQLSAQLESLYICVSLDYLMILQDFFIAGLPTGVNKNVSSSNTSISTKTDQRASRPSTVVQKLSTSLSKASAPQSPNLSTEDEEVETHVDVIVKNPEVILLEDQHKLNSNCLVLDLALQMRMINVGEDTKLYGWLKDLTVYSSNFAELKDSKNSQSKIKYRILQPAKADIIMIMNDKQQKFDLRISDIIVSIAPAAVRTLIAVTSSLGTLQTTVPEKEKVNVKTLFNPKPFKDANFWFTKDSEENQKELETVDILETVTGLPSQLKEAKEEEKKRKENEENMEIEKPLIQQLILTLETIEVKLEVGLGSITKSVVAMCLSNLTADVKNWSSELSLSSTVNVEAALFNEHILTWEPLIEPTINETGSVLSPWCITCSIVPVLSYAKNGSVVIDEQERKEGIPSSDSKQIITIRADRLLNITITKAGINLIQRLSGLFNDVYNKRLPFTDDEIDQPMLSVLNGTGQEITIAHLDGVEIAKNTSSTSINLKHNESIPLVVLNERHSTARLSVIEEQNLIRRQEFSVQIGDVIKTVSISRTWQRVYNLGQSSNPNWPIEMLCDTQIRNDRRHVILSSIIKVYNNTTMPLAIISIDSLNTRQSQKVTTIHVNEEYHVPINLLYAHSSSLIFIAIDEHENNEEINDFFSFDWELEYTSERKLKLTNGKEAHFTVFKEVNTAYSENTDQLDRSTFNIYIYPALHLTNLLPMDIQCSVDNVEQINLKPSELNSITFGSKHSTLTFIIPSYANIKWISEPVDLNVEGKGDRNEHLVRFHNSTSSNSQAILNMVLRVDSFNESYRLLLYSPFWVLNRTELNLEFQIENNSTLIAATETPYLVCPDKFNSGEKRKGQLRLYTTAQGDNAANWSETFSVDVIKSTGITSCKVPNDRVYMICVDIVTSSFGLTKIITLSPSVVIMNKSTVEIEIVETVSNKEQDKWGPVNPEQVIPFWPHNIQNGLMRVRYTHNRVTSRPFLMNEKHRTLLHMEDTERPAIYVEVTATDFDGVRVIFGDYKIGDAPVLLVNCLKDESIAFSQADDIQAITLPPQHYVYYTWLNPLKARALSVNCNESKTELGLNPQCGFLKKDSEHNINYAMFMDGIQTVLLISDDTKIIAAASGMPALAEAMGQRLQIGIHDIGISIVNDVTREEILYISLNKSKVIWTETKRCHVRPLSHNLNKNLEELYKSYVEECETNPDNKSIQRKKYHVEEFQEISFSDNKAELVNSKGQRKSVKRQALDGLWIEYGWSVTNTALHVRINRVQIDNQLDYTIFPVILYPIISKTTSPELSDKPFIELSVYESKTTQSNVMQFKYFKLLIQEFAVKIDQGLIVALLAFIQSEKISAAPTVNMETDLEQIQKPLTAIIKAQTDAPSGETEMVFDNIHLSPLKIHVSFSMHGSKPSEALLATYPLVGFLLRTLNVAEVQDVILRLGYYERTNDRYTTTRLTNEVLSHYQNQFMKQLHVLVLGLDVLGNPIGVIRGLAEGVESFFYEPYKGAIEGPMEFAEGVVTGVRTLFGSAVGGAAGAFSKITGVLGKGLATLTFDEDYKVSRMKRQEPATKGRTEIAIEGKNVVMGFVEGVKGVVTKPVSGAKESGASGFVKGLGKGFLGLVTRPTGGIVDFTSTSLDLLKRTAQQEDIVRRVRYPRHVGRDGLVRPYIPHEAMGFYILNRLQEGKYAKSDTYIAHITCTEHPLSWLMATSRRLLFITEISFLGLYETDWEIPYEELKEEPIAKPNLCQIQILTKEPQKTGTIRSALSYGKMVKYRNISEARYIIEKIIYAMHTAAASLSTAPLFSLSAPILSVEKEHLSSYIQYKFDENHHYRPSLVSFLHRQPDGSQLATIRYYRIVFHCNILPGSLYLRFSKTKPYRTVVQNRQDPSTIFGFRSVGAYSRVQIQNHISSVWLCMNEQGKIVPKLNITVDNLACTFRQNSDGPYLKLISELYPSRQMFFNTLRLLSLNPILRRRYAQYMTNGNNFFKRERCSRFIFDRQIDNALLNRTIDPFLRLRR